MTSFCRVLKIKRKRFIFTCNKFPDYWCKIELNMLYLLNPSTSEKLVKILISPTYSSSSSSKEIDNILSLHPLHDVSCNDTVDCILVKETNSVKNILTILCDNSSETPEVQERNRLLIHNLYELSINN